MTTKEAISKVFNSMPIGTQFRGWELKKRVSELKPSLQNVYTDTVLRRFREICHGRYRVCGPYSQSLYEKTS